MWLITNDINGFESTDLHKAKIFGEWTVFGNDESIQYITDVESEQIGSGVFLSFDKIKIQTDIYLSDNIFYYMSKTATFVSNDIRILLSNRNIPFLINIDTCKKYLTIRSQVEDRLASDDETFFNQIYRIAPNNKVELSKEKIITSIWKNTIQNIQEQPYEGQSVRSILAKQISQVCSGNEDERFGIELSGGLDSACVLAELIACGCKPNKLFAFIMTFEDEELVDTNDVYLATKLVDHFGINAYLIYGDKSLRSQDYQELNVCNINGPTVSANYLWLQTLNALCKKLGIKYVFTGNGGDELLGGSPYVYDYEFFLHPIKTIRRLISDSPPKSRGIRFRKLLFKPALFPWNYYPVVWEEKNNPIPTFFTEEQLLLEKKERNLSRKRIASNKRIKGWGRKFVYDFSINNPDYMADFFDDIKFVNPIYCWDMFCYTNSVRPELLFDLTKNGFYRSSKRRLREDYIDILPEYILGKENKTSYNQMSRKMFSNGFPRVFALFSDENSIVANLGLIDAQKFKNELIRLYITCIDASAQVDLSFRYIWGVIKLEMWLRFINQGREKVLEKSHRSNINCLLCEVRKYEKTNI